MTSQFSATASALGYTYQFRYGLLRALARVRSHGTAWTIALEAADDLEVAGITDAELIQTKLRKRATLTDLSTDFWKSVRVWAEQIRSGAVEPESTDFVLVSTASVSEQSFLAAIGPDGTDDPTTLIDAMRAAGKRSESETVAKALTAFDDLPPQQARHLASNMRILANAPDILDVEAELRRELGLSARPEHLDAFLERLEGRWFRRCLRQMAGADGPISGDEVSAFVNDLRDGFRSDSLPIDPEYNDETRAVDEFAEYTFYRQLELIEATSGQFAMAVRDYLRAFEQTSRWSRDGLLLTGELGDYEDRLVREWHGVFEMARLEGGASAADEAKRTAALKVYRWASIEAQVPIRENCVEAFLTRGQLHHLADDLRVGWHPDFEARLAQLLEPAAEEA